MTSCASAAGLLLGLCQIIEQSATVFRLDLCPGLSESCNGGICFTVTASLDEKILLLADEVLSSVRY